MKLLSRPLVRWSKLLNTPVFYIIVDIDGYGYIVNNDDTLVIHIHLIGSYIDTM
ncbi:MAG: hypothetical protein KJN76_02800 [Eudoraea sp.]|nr:hypothetical protein [Eudoraea sp.]